MTDRVMDTSVVTPARQRLSLRMPPFSVFSASLIAQPKLLRASLVNSGTSPLPVPHPTPRITSSTASTPAAGVPLPTTVIRIWRLSPVISPSAPTLPLEM